MSSHSIADNFEKYRRQLLSFIRNRTSGEDAEDTLQDVFLRLVEADRISPITQVANWLYQATRNKIIDNSRKKREERMPEIRTRQDDGAAFMVQISELMISEDYSPEKEQLRNAIWEELEDALADLPQEQRYVFEQTEFKGRTFKELSKETGLPVNTLISRKHYAVKSLRYQLREIYEDLIQ